MYKSNQKRLSSYVAERRGEERYAANHQRRLDKLNAEQLGLDEQAQRYATIVSNVSKKLTKAAPVAAPVAPVAVSPIADLIARFLQRTPSNKFEKELHQTLLHPDFKAKFHEHMSNYLSGHPDATDADIKRTAYVFIGGAGKKAKTHQALENNQARLKHYVSERRIEENNADAQQLRLDRYLDELRGRDLQANQYAKLANRIGSRLSDAPQLSNASAALSVLATAVSNQTLSQLLKRFTQTTPSTPFGVQMQANLSSQDFQQQFNSGLSDFIESNPKATSVEVATQVAELIGGPGNEAEVLKELEALRSENRDLQAQNGTLEMQKAMLQSANNALSSQLVGEVLKYNEAVRLFHSHVLGLSEQLEKTKQDLSASKASRGDTVMMSNAVFATLRSKIDAMDEDNQRVFKANTYLSEKLKEALTSLASQDSEYQAQLQAQLQHLHGLNSENQQLQVALTALKDQVSELESAKSALIQEKHAAAQELRAAHAHFKSEIDKSNQAQKTRDREHNQQLAAQRRDALSEIETIRRESRQQIQQGEQVQTELRGELQDSERGRLQMRHRFNQQRKESLQQNRVNNELFQRSVDAYREKARVIAESETLHRANGVLRDQVATLKNEISDLNRRITEMQVEPDVAMPEDAPDIAYEPDVAMPDPVNHVGLVDGRENGEIEEPVEVALDENFHTAGRRGGRGSRIMFGMDQSAVFESRDDQGRSTRSRQ